MELMNKEVLMKRLADASQSKVYPTVASRYEVPLRKILLTTRLWNNVRKEQDFLPDAWLEEFMSQDELKKKDILDWSWFDQDEILLLETISKEDTLKLLSHEKRAREQEDLPDVKKIKVVDQDFLNRFNNDPSPAGPASPVLLSA